MSDLTEEQFKALLKDGTPTQVLQVMYSEAPDGVKAFVDMHSAAFLGLELPKLHTVVSEGPVMLRKSLPSLSEAYAGAMESESNGLKLSATVVDAGRDLATVIDKAVSRTLLDAEDCNRMEYLNLISLHARIVSALDKLDVTEEQRSLIQKAKDEDDATNDS